MSHRETSGSLILKLRYHMTRDVTLSRIIFYLPLYCLWLNISYTVNLLIDFGLGYDFMVLCVNKRIQYVLSAWHAGSKTVKENSH